MPGNKVLNSLNFRRSEISLHFAFICLCLPFSLRRWGSGQITFSNGTSLSRMRVVCTRGAFLPPTSDGGEGHGLELLLICQGQAVLHRLLQHLLTLVRAPAWTVAVDDILGGETKTGGQNGLRGEEQRLVRGKWRPNAQKYEETYVTYVRVRMAPDRSNTAAFILTFLKPNADFFLFFFG